MKRRPNPWTVGTAAAVVLGTVTAAVVLAVVDEKPAIIDVIMEPRRKRDVITRMPVEVVRMFHTVTVEIERLLGWVHWR